MKNRIQLLLGIAIAIVSLTIIAVHGAWTRTEQPPAQTVQTAVPTASQGVFAVVNGTPVAAELARIMLDDRGGDSTASNSTMHQQVAEQLVRNELFVQQALQLGLDKDPDIERRTEMAHRDLLANAYLRAYDQAHPITIQQIQAEYERRKARLIGEKEYSVRHILVADSVVAKQIIQRLRAGAAFAQLVDDFSLDDASKNYGGSLGWISVDNADKALIDVVAKLKSGHRTSVPIQTPLGWDVVELDAVREIRILPLDAVKARFLAQLRQAQTDTLAQTLWSQAKVAWPSHRSTPVVTVASR